MTLYYAANSAALAAITTGANDTVLLKTGETFAASSVPAGLLTPSGVTVGYYGTGAKPIISGAVVRADWVFDAGNNVYSRSAASNILGNVTEDGIPMKFVAWNTDIATTAASMVSGSNGIYWAGSFTYNPATFTIYIRPSSGTASSHEYKCSESLYGFSVTSAGSNSTVDGIDFRSISRHGILVQNRVGFAVTNADFRIIGGNIISLHAGNGIEFAENTHGATAVDCLFEDIFDTAATSQAYATSKSRITGHLYERSTIKRFGMHGIEVSAHTADQFISDIEINGVTASDQGIGWSGDRSGSVVINICTNTTRTSITRSFARNVSSNNCRRLYLGYQHGGTCGIEDSSGVATYGLLPTSNANGRAGTIDLWRNVTDNLGAPSGGAWSQVSTELRRSFMGVV